MATETFSMRMDAEIKRRLEAKAANLDRSAAWVAQRAIESFLKREELKADALHKAIAEAESGVFVSAEAVERWMDRWAEGFDDPFPEPDITSDRKPVA